MTTLAPCKRCGKNNVTPGKLCGPCELDTDTGFGAWLHDFPVDILPSKLATYAKTHAASTPAPIGWIGAAIVNVACGALGHRRKLAVKSTWVASPRNWTAIIGLSGSRKTPALEPLTRPMIQVERDLIKQNTKSRHAWLALSKAEKQATRQPGHAQFVFQNITWEALMRAVEDGTDFWGDFDELSVFLRQMGQYKDGGGADRDHWVSIHSKGLINYRRVRDDLRIFKEDVHLSLLGGLQPSKIPLLRDGSGDGLEYRFLFARGDWIPLRDAVGETIGQSWYEGCIRSLCELPARVHSLPSAFSYLASKETEYERAGVESGVRSKALSYIACNAIALAELRNLHEGGSLSGSVLSEDIERAGRLQEYFIDVWENDIVNKIGRGYVTHGRDVNTQTVYAFANSIWEKAGDRPVTRSLCMNRGWGGIDSKLKMDALVHMVEELGTTSPVLIETKSPKMTFRVPKNPRS